MRISIVLPESTRSRALAAGAVLAALVMVFALLRACTSGGSGLDPLPAGEKRPEPVSFSDGPMWDERKLGMVEVAGVELHGDRAIVAGEADGGTRLAVVDVRTGRPHWVVDAGFALKDGGGAEARNDPGFRAEHMRGAAGRPLVYGDGDDWAVLVHYTEGPRGAETELGVAALSGKDGTVRWKHPLVRPRSGDKGDKDREQTVRLLAADTRAVLTSVEGERGSDPKTVALDPATGKKLWENEDGWAYRFAGGLVLGETRGEQPPSGPWGKERNGTDVFALDVRTGDKRWDLSGAFDSSHLDAIAGGTAVVNVQETEPGQGYIEDRRTALLDAATGRETGSGGGGQDGDQLWGCADDGRTLIACAGSGGRLVTVRPGDGEEPFVTKKPPFDRESRAQVRLVWQDRIFVHASSRGDRPARHAVVDRAANRIGPAPPGEIAAVSEQVAAFRVDREGSSPEPEGLVVHTAAAGAEPPEPSGPGDPTPEPPRIEAAPLWTAAAGETPAPAQAKDTGLLSLNGVDLAGDAVVYLGRDRKNGVDELVVVDAGTGDERWSFREGTSLGGGAKVPFIYRFHIVDVDGEQLVLLDYSASGGRQGFAALSLKDGTVRWKTPVQAGGGTAILKATGARTIIVEVTEHDGFADVRDEIIVYATGSRRELWRKRGVEPVSAGGGLVLASRSGPGESGDRKRLDLVAYGASDGDRRWRLGGRYREPQLLHDGGGETIVVATAGGAVVLDRATGRELADIHMPLAQCDGDTLIVCETGPDDEGRDPGARAVTIRTRDGVPEIHDLLETESLTRYTAIGNWFAAVRPATESGSGGTPERFGLFDAEGRQAPDDLPGLPKEIGGGFAVLTPSKVHHGHVFDEVSSFTVHRVQG